MIFLIHTLLGGLIGAGVVFTFLAFLLQKGRLSSLLRSKLLNPVTLSLLLHHVDGEEELTPLIDQQLDAFIRSFKERHAMIGMFLTPSIADPLKEEGRARLLHMVPGLKEKIAKNLSQEKYADKGEIALKGIIKQKMPMILLSSFSLGSIFGLLGGFILWWFQP